MNSEKSSTTSQELSKDNNNWELMSEKEESSDPASLYNNFIIGYKPEDVEQMKKEILKKSPTEQLDEILFLYDTMVYHLENASDIEDVNWHMLGGIENVINAIPADNTTTPLVRYAKGLVSREEMIMLRGSYVSKLLGDKWWNVYGRVASTHRWQRQLYQNQDELHKDYPFLPKDQLLEKISPNTVATLDSGFNFVDLVDKNGSVVSFANQDDNRLGIGEDSLKLIKNLHHHQMEWVFWNRLGISLTDVSLPAQMQLLKFVTEADDGRFDRLCSTLHGVDEKVRLKLAEGFLAADFGDDFGDALLDIAGSERISDEQLGEILDKMNSCRESIHDITELYHGFDDGKFAHEYARAANERLTDALMVFREIALNGGASTNLGWFGEANFGYKNAMEALEYETKSLSIISGTLGDVAAGRNGTFAERFLSPDKNHWRAMYNFYSPEYGYVLLYTRPEGSGTFDPMTEYGKVRNKYDKENNNSGVEASISMIVNPKAPFKIPSPFRPDRHKVKDMGYYDHTTMDKVSAIRLDREGRAPDTPPDDPNRDPINPIGTISVDLAAINDRVDTPSGKIARLFSVGNSLRAKLANDDTSLNHNTHWFNQSKYGTADGFKSLVEHVDSLAMNWCGKIPPKDGEGITWLMRVANRGRGQKTMKAIKTKTSEQVA